MTDERVRELADGIEGTLGHIASRGVCEELAGVIARLVRAMLSEHAAECERYTDAVMNAHEIHVHKCSQKESAAEPRCTCPDDAPFDRTKRSPSHLSACPLFVLIPVSPEAIEHGRRLVARLNVDAAEPEKAEAKGERYWSEGHGPNCALTVYEQDGRPGNLLPECTCGVDAAEPPADAIPEGAPERLGVYECVDGSWKSGIRGVTISADKRVDYIRADLHAALEAKLARYEAAMREIANAKKLHVPERADAAEGDQRGYNRASKCPRCGGEIDPMYGKCRDANCAPTPAAADVPERVTLAWSRELGLDGRFDSDMHGRRGYEPVDFVPVARLDAAQSGATTMKAAAEQAWTECDEAQRKLAEALVENEKLKAEHVEDARLRVQDATYQGELRVQLTAATQRAEEAEAKLRTLEALHRTAEEDGPTWKQRACAWARRTRQVEDERDAFREQLAAIAARRSGK